MLFMHFIRRTQPHNGLILSDIDAKSQKNLFFATIQSTSKLHI